METSKKKTIGKVVGGCGCTLLILAIFWLVFVVYIGIQGRGNDEEASIVIAGITCMMTGPVVLLTLVGFYFGLRQEEAQ